MNQAVEKKVVSYLTGKEDIEAVDVEQLRSEEAESPYFPITQLLLARKLAATNRESYSIQLQKTALYFSNPFWLQHLLSAGEGSLDEEDPYQQARSSSQVVA